MNNNYEQFTPSNRESFASFLFIPAEIPEIPEGYYSRNQFVNLMRKYKNNPDVIQFLADMLE
jgi:hypothetical protein